MKELNSVGDIRAYWDGRWKDMGCRGGVSPVQMIDEEYVKRNKRDEERLTAALEAIGIDKFETGAECGAGAGRLTPFYNGFINKLSCFDISEEACQHFAKSGLKNEYYVMPLSDIGHKFANSFDIAISFTVIQHIHSLEAFDLALQSIQNSLKKGGIYLLHEDISASKQGKQAAPHMNNYGVRDYSLLLDACEAVYSREYYYKETNEHDLVAVYQKR